MKTFKDLPIGTRFDWISGTFHDSFFLECIKISPRRYVDSLGVTHRVGSIHAEVRYARPPSRSTDSTTFLGRQGPVDIAVSTADKGDIYMARVSALFPSPVSK